MRVTGIGRLLALVVAAVTGGATSLTAQSLLERTPNVNGGWVGSPATLHFNFLHRFNHSGAPQRQVSNRPTFTLAYGLPHNLLLGTQYLTRSDITAGLPNEWEPFARLGLLNQDVGLPLDLSVTAAYNSAAESVDGELGLARRFGPVRLLGAGRVLSSGYSGDARYAVAGGAAVRISQWLAIAGDVGTLLERTGEEKVPWAVALQFGIPLTPHSLSLQATNTNSATLQGASRGGEDIRWGFEFTVPVSLRRYFGERQAPPPPEVAAASDSVRRALLRDSVRAELEIEYRRRWLEDSLRLALRDDSVRLAQQLAAARAQASADSVRRAEAEAARAAADRAARAAQAPTTQARTVRANIRNLAYAPATIEIEPGTTVVWRNNDQLEHTVTAVDRSWDSGLIRPGASWQRTFREPGTYAFFCTPHPFMRGTVIVRQRP